MPTTTFCTLARVIAIARKLKESVSIGIMRGNSRLRVALYLRPLI